MYNQRLYKLIKNREAKTFIEEMPEGVRQKAIFIEAKPNQVIALKGNTIDAIYINLQGEMQVTNEFENGFIYRFAEVDDLGYIGAMELMAKEQSYICSVETLTDCLILKLAREDFMAWIKEDHLVTLKILQFVSRIMYEQSVNKGEVLAYPAIYSLMSYFISVYESEEAEVAYLTKTREEISSILGFSMRTINRNLKQLKEQGCVTVNRKYLAIHKEEYERLVDQLKMIK